MDAGTAWSLLLLLNAVVYVAFVLRRNEGSLVWSLSSSLLTGPLCWFIWLAMRAGKRNAEIHQFAAPGPASEM